MQDTASNIPIYSVSQISAEVRRAIEGQFEWVRIRGEVSRPTRARSGHFYLTLKDEKAVIDAVAWKGVAAKIPFDVSEGMELIATGKLTTFAGHSKYQLIIETLELAGEGALLKMLEMRRKALHAEGLFDPSVKKPLPLLPRRIGVVSSPNGAVIRDIWHRISGRFPLSVTLWPVRVQGQGAAGEVARAIAGFDAMPADARPDLLIVARGGGSLEDLWTFNEEEVIRAAAACQIPLISAIGHETDTTLLDYVADLRAPTPTAAAEFAVPIRTDLLAEVAQLGERAKRSLFSNLQQSQQGLDDVSRALGSPDALVSRAARDLAAVVQSLTQAQRPYFERLALTLDHTWSRLPKPRQKLLELWQSLKSLDARARMAGALRRAIAQGEQQIEGLGARLEAQHRAREALKAQGWAHVLDDKGQSLVSAGQVLDGEGYTLRFHDGDAAVVGGASGDAVPADAPNKPKRLSKPAKTNPHQDTLF